MGELSGKTNCTTKGKTGGSCTTSAVTNGKGSATGAKDANIVCSHRTPRQLHASTYVAVDTRIAGRT